MDEHALTRSERASLARIRERQEADKAKADEERRRREEADLLVQRRAASLAGATLGDGGEPCPFPHSSPEGIAWHLNRTLARVGSIVADPAATNRDVLDAASLLRQAAGLGKEAPPPEVYVLDMDSMLGGLDEADGGDDDPA